MRQIVFLALLLFTQAITHAQFKVIAEGPVFDEPESGFARILQLKNGSTLFVHIAVKDGIDVKIYDAKHKQQVMKHITPEYGKLKMGSIDGIFEVNGDAVLLISEIDSKTPVLYRVIIDGKTGSKKKEEKIAELKKYNMGSGYAMMFGGVPMPDFYVRKDPNSDNYAVAMLNSFESDRNKRIEVVLYGADNNEISRSYYASPDNKYKYMEYIDMAVLGSEKVCVLASAYNTRASGGKESELVLSTLEKGKTSMTLDELSFSKDLKITNGITRYNPLTKKVVLLAVVKGPDRKSDRICYMLSVDPATRKADKAKQLFPQKASDKSVELFGRKSTFKGLPQNLFINNDGSFSVVFEELELVYPPNTSMMAGATGVHTSVRLASTELGNMAVSTYDMNGKETSCYFVPKSHYLFYTGLSPLYHSDREGSAQQLNDGNQFKSFAYLNGKDKMYILFNDVEENAERVLKGKITTIRGLGECDGYYYTLSGGDVMPARNFVFGKEERRKDHNMGLFAISDYDRENNVYVTLKLEKEGRDKGVKLVWMTP